jgi:hypothetical protein
MYQAILPLIPEGASRINEFLKSFDSFSCYATRINIHRLRRIASAFLRRNLFRRSAKTGKSLDPESFSGARDTACRKKSGSYPTTQGFEGQDATAIHKSCGFQPPNSTYRNFKVLHL